MKQDNSDTLAYREAYHLGCCAYRQGISKQNNAFFHCRATPSGRVKYAAWRHGWEREAYQTIMGNT